MVLLLDRCPGLDAVFVASSLIATGALRERGLQYAEVAVVGLRPGARPSPRQRLRP